MAPEQKLFMAILCFLTLSSVLPQGLKFTQLLVPWSILVCGSRTEVVYGNFMLPYSVERFASYRDYNSHHYLLPGLALFVAPEQKLICGNSVCPDSVKRFYQLQGRKINTGFRVLFCVSMGLFAIRPFCFLALF